MSTQTEIRTAAGRVWAYRASQEREAAARFFRIARRVREVFPALEHLARDAARDELRHGDFCDALAEKFGVTARVLVRVPPDVGPRGLTFEQRVLYEVVAACCVSETLSATALSQIHMLAKDAHVADIAHTILKDEVSHSRLGWAALSEAKRTTDVSFLSRYVGEMLRFAAGDELYVGAPDLTAPEECAEGLGVLSTARRRDVVTSTVRDVLLPGFASLGVTLPAQSPELRAVG
ncbi:MAG TPA: ferritin-like domain-containing protein [Polyangiaceae bacterium]|nr:ferritin-like domain-containing protein [Polyangiaceae bacterium]